MLRQVAIAMSRRARLTILELGASPDAWASQRGRDADDCIVIAQQSDESDQQFTERVSKRARRLRCEDASLESVDIYTAPRPVAPSSTERVSVIEALADQMSAGTRLTLWSNSTHAAGGAELTATLAKFAHLLVEHRIAVNPASPESELKSGIRHARPAPLRAANELSYELVGDEPSPVPRIALARKYL